MKTAFHKKVSKDWADSCHTCQIDCCGPA